jgi:2-amino-4-hydroxy-6-hydroxymethyldihydropteridine diphosphokinase
LQNLQEALNYIKTGNKILAISSVYSNPPMGFKAALDFYNAVVSIETTYQPLDLLKFVKMIEMKMGRKKNFSGQYESRIIDLDILDYNGEIVESSELQLPHKEIQSRSFVIVPLLEVAPKWVHPVFNKNLIQLVEQVSASDSLIKLSEKLV